jgi:hypothetical protein
VKKCGTTDIGVNIGINRDQLIFTINIFINFLVVLKAGGMTKPIVCPIPFVSTSGVTDCEHDSIVGDPERLLFCKYPSPAGWLTSQIFCIAHDLGKRESCF